MNRVATALWNPIVAKEYRSRMRTWRSPLAMSIYILLLGVLGWAIFSAQAGSARSAFNSGQAASYGHELFRYLILFQIVLIAFVTPALTAGAISGERERQTIDLLFVTRIPPFSIVWGKLIASMSFVLLLLILSVPIFSLVFLFGGIELDQVLVSFLVTLVAALTLGLLGIAFSTIFSRTLPSTVASYGVGFILLAGTYVYGLVFPTIVDPSSTVVARVAPAPPAITYISPIESLLAITDGTTGGYGVRYGPAGGFSNGGCSSGPGVQSCYAVPMVAPGVVGKGFYNGQPVSTGTSIPSGLFKGWQFWQATVALQLTICLIALVASAIVLSPSRRLPWQRRAPAPKTTP
ncbi:MAG: ABC transporter permease [Candidatus Dormibacteraeota bacterium]|nr:ABC transporter permease [Candidatus Dormibacteraeota bacterium]